MQSWRANFLAEHGMLLVLLLLCAFFSVATWSAQHPTGTGAAAQLVPRIRAEVGDRAHVVIVVRDSAREEAFADAVRKELTQQGITVVQVLRGQPAQVRAALADLALTGVRVDAYVCNRATSVWTIYDKKVIRPEIYYWPNFLKADNLLNIANQIAVIAIMAIGMTMVVIAGGIDLSVGSLIALSAVVTARLIRDHAGAEEAAPLGMIICSLAAMALCAAAGLFSGIMTTAFRIPSFIVTLAMMLEARGYAEKWSENQSINQVPESFIWLGRGADLFGIPNAVVLMFALYLLAHFVMTRTVLGRYIHAVGGNAEAARLSGVPVRRIVWIVFTLSGLLAGLGGVIMASQLKSGAPTYGQMYELMVIAAVVVGGTSLSGGKGKVFGTLTGAFIIAVIQNGMNLMALESSNQRIVLGAVILGAVVLDRIREGRSTAS